MSRGCAEPDSKAVAFSGRLFQRLLAAYPKEHRREYGPAMAQLFRDQCRDAWRDGRTWGLTVLWLRVLPDLIKTSALERVSALKERNTVLERISVLLEAVWKVVNDSTLTLSYFCAQFRTSCGCVTQLI